ncbi:MAG: hypothetical protein HY735_31410 [Verrucomicrobia bacterium]|nr:hypothetical protein [Verrucomicrobiota bacterium]
MKHENASNRPSQRCCSLTLVLAMALLGQATLNAANILFVINSVVDPATTANAHDQEVFDRLTGQKHKVTLADDSTVSAADTVGIDLVLISSSTGSGEPGVNPLCRNTLRAGRIPVINYEPALNDELTLQTADTYGNANGHTSLAINSANKSHPLAAGKSGTVDIVNPGDAAVVSSSAVPLTIGREALIIATNATPDIDVDRIAIWAYDTGSRLADNATIVPSRRVAFFFNASTAPGAYTENAYALFDAAVKWALERPASFPVAVVTRLPAPEQSGVALDTTIVVEIEDGSATQVNQSSIKMTLNGTSVGPTISKSGTRTKLTAKPATPLAGGAAVTVVVSFSDTASPPASFTDSWKFTTERPPLLLPPFRPNKDGTIVVEAENFHAIEPKGGHTWNFGTALAGYSGDGYMESSPDIGVSRNDTPGFSDQSPRLDFKVNFTQPGTYFVWVRGYGKDGSGDSLHVGLDKQELDTSDRITGWGTSFVWARARQSPSTGNPTIDVLTAGEHTISVWMREDGVIIDKLLLTADENFTPTGLGPAQSLRVGEPDPPTIESVLPADGALGVALKPKIEIILADGTVQVASNSIQLSVNGSPVAAAVNKTGARTTVTYTPAADLPAGSRIDVKLSYADTATPAVTRTFSSAFVTIRSAPTGLAPLQQGADGLIVTEAENYDALTPQGDHTWIFGAFFAGFSAQGYMESTPNVAVNQSNYPDLLTMSPRLDYRVNFAKTGTHYIWVRGFAQEPNVGENDSVNAGIDGDNPDSARRIDGTPGFSTTWRWVGNIQGNTRSTIEVPTTGLHTVNIWMREDGFALDKVIITSDPNYSPTGTGPADSRVAPPPTGEAPKFSGIRREGNDIVVEWSGPGTLESADAVSGPWTPSTAASPFKTALAGAAKFYRLRR